MNDLFTLWFLLPAVNELCALIRDNESEETLLSMLIDSHDQEDLNLEDTFLRQKVAGAIALSVCTHRLIFDRFRLFMLRHGQFLFSLIVTKRHWNNKRIQRHEEHIKLLRRICKVSEITEQDWGVIMKNQQALTILNQLSEEDLAKIYAQMVVRSFFDESKIVHNSETRKTRVDFLDQNCENRED